MAVVNRPTGGNQRLDQAVLDAETSPRVDEHSTIQRAILRTRVEPSADRVYGIAYNDLHDESIAYHLVPHAPYHSFVLGENFRIDTDANGYPVFLRIPSEVNETEPDSQLVPPQNTERGRLRFLDLRVRYHAVRIRANRHKSLYCIVFHDAEPTRHVAVGPHSIWSLDRLGRLCAVWLTGVRSDPTGRRFLRWRRDAWRRVRLESVRSQHPVEVKPTPLSAPGTGSGA